MGDLLDTYKELNPNNYEISALREDLELANKRLRKINDLAEEV
jgi:nitrogen regulatory protein PII-like uncharacterized protein